MNELFDKLIIQILFAVLFCLSLFLYKYAHALFFPSTRLQLLGEFSSTKNGPEAIHFFSRLLGIGIIFGHLQFSLSDGIGIAVFDMLTQSLSIFVLFLASNYILESIVLFNFDYQDEIAKKKNFSYAIVTMAHALTSGFIVKTVVVVSGDSLAMMLLIWLLAMCLLGFSTKSFSLISKLSFNQLLMQKNMAVGISYLGFHLGWAIMISSSLYHGVLEIRWYLIQVFLKVLLSLIILPLFMFGIKWVFNMKDDSEVAKKPGQVIATPIGYGIFEGTLFFCSSFLTSVITNNIQFGTFYPVQ